MVLADCVIGTYKYHPNVASSPDQCLLSLFIASVQALGFGLRQHCRVGVVPSAEPLVDHIG